MNSEVVEFEKTNKKGNIIKSDVCINCQLEIPVHSKKLSRIIRNDKITEEKLEIGVSHAIEAIFNFQEENTQFNHAFLCEKCGSFLELAYNALADFIELTQNVKLLSLMSQFQSAEDGLSNSNNVESKNVNASRKKALQSNFKCSVCNRKFSKASFLLKHTKAYHGKKSKRVSVSIARGEPIKKKLQACSLGKSSEEVRKHVNELEINSRNDGVHANDACIEKMQIGDAAGTTVCNFEKSEIKGAYSCEICDKKYFRKDFLAVHLKSHTGEKPHTCDTCGKAFGDPRGLDNHVITHSSARPYCCSLCGKTFKRLHHLKDHEKNHEDIPRAFKCLICGKAFKFKKHFNSHQLSHRGNKEHQCQLCLKSFNRKDNLQQHIKNVHGKRDKE